MAAMFQFAVHALFDLKVWGFGDLQKTFERLFLCLCSIQRIDQ